MIDEDHAFAELTVQLRDQAQRFGRDLVELYMTPVIVGYELSGDQRFADRIRSVLNEAIE
jgi:hypothetical protein